MLLAGGIAVFYERVAVCGITGGCGLWMLCRSLKFQEQARRGRVSL